MNSLTHEPVKRALVALEGQNAENLSALTDDAGKFLFGNVKPGNYLLSAGAPGYPRKVSQGISVAADKQINGVTMSLRPGGIISGKVIDADGDPMPNQTVRAVVYSYAGGVKKLVTAALAMTNDRGEHRLYDLMPRRYYLVCGSFSRPQVRGRIHHQEPDLDYAQTFYPDSADAAGAAPVSVAAGVESSGVDIQRRRVPMMHVRGKVTGLAAPSGAAVVVTSCTGDNLSGVLNFRSGPPISFDSQQIGQLLAAEVQADGSFDVAHVAPGKHCMSLMPGRAGIHGVAQQEFTLADKDLDHADLAVSPPFELHGSILVEGAIAGTPGKAVLFMAPDAENAGFLNQTVNLNDSFVAQEVASIPYHVSLDLPRNLYVKSIRLGSQEQEDSRVHIRSGAEPLTILVATDAGQVSGTVKSADGDPVASMVAVVPAGLSRFGAARNGNSDEKGHFTITGLAPGDYEVLAIEELDMSAIASPDYRKALQPKIASATVPPSGSASVELTVISSDELAVALEKMQ